MCSLVLRAAVSLVYILAPALAPALALALALAVPYACAQYFRLNTPTINISTIPPTKQSAPH